MEATKLSVTGVQCSLCDYILVSRADHDMHWCPCGTVAVDGGRSYLKVAASELRIAKTVRIDIPYVTKEDLVRDYQKGLDKFKSFEPETHAVLNVREPTKEELANP